MASKKIRYAAVLALLCVFLLAPFSYGHSNVLLNVDLEFDPALKEDVVSKAQQFLNVTEDPKRIDYDYELLAIGFDRPLEYMAYVNPSSNGIHGFRDSSLISKGEEKFSQEQRKEIAQNMFDSLPPSFKEELAYSDESKLYTGMYRHKWYRLVNSVMVSNDYFEAEVNPTSGKIVAWKLTPFIIPRQDMETAPAISGEVARQIGLLSFNAKPVDFEPILIIEGAIPVWIVKVKGIYPFYVAIDARDGSVRYSGGIKTELPPHYAVGKNIHVAQSDLVKAIYDT